MPINRLPLLIASFFLFNSAFAQKASNEMLVQYEDGGIKRNACYDFVMHSYGLYMLGTTPANAEDVKIFFKGVTESQFTNTTVNGLIKLKLITNNQATSAKTLGGAGILVEMKTKNNNLDDWMATYGKAGKICVAAMQKLQN